jgi:hypothetical protein
LAARLRRRALREKSGARQKNFSDAGVAGGGCAGGFYFFEEAGAAEAAGGGEVGGQGNRRQLSAPTAAFGLAGHGRVALGAKFLHRKIMTRSVARVESDSRSWRSGGFLVSEGKRVLSLHVRGVFAKLTGCGYTLTLQSLTGNLSTLESRA